MGRIGEPYRPATDLKSDFMLKIRFGMRVGTSRGLRKVIFMSIPAACAENRVEVGVSVRPVRAGVFKPSWPPSHS